MLSSLSPQAQQRVAVIVPLIALAVSLFVVYPGWQNLKKVKAESQQLQQKLQTLRDTPIPLPAAQEPAVAQTPSEPPEFLESIRRIALEAGCQVVGFDLTLPPAPATGEKEAALGGNPDPVKEQQEMQKTELVKPVRAKIEIEATYPQIRDFLEGVRHAPRLYAIVGVEVAQPRGETAPGLISGTVEIERYVLNPDAPPPPGPPL